MGYFIVRSDPEMSISVDEAGKLADTLAAAADAIEDFADDNDTDLTPTEYRLLAGQATSLRTTSRRALVDAVGLAIEGMDEPGKRLKGVVDRARSTLNTLTDIKKGIRIATAVLTIATGIAARDPLLVRAAHTGLADELDR